MRRAFRSRLPSSVHRLVVAWRRLRRPAPASGAFGGLEPFSRVWGLDRGTPINRYYVDRFLRAHAADVRGSVLEVGDPRYTHEFGGDRVTRSEVVHLIPGNPQATLVGDLATGRGLPEGAFDCLIVTFTLLLIYDVRGAIATCARLLKPGGVLLAHFAGVEKTAPADPSYEGDYWRFTSRSARRLVEEAFPAEGVTVEVFGNVLAASASLYGLSAEEVGATALDHRGADYEVATCVRAVMPPAS